MITITTLILLILKYLTIAIAAIVFIKSIVSAKSTAKEIQNARRHISDWGDSSSEKIDEIVAFYRSIKRTYMNMTFSLLVLTVLCFEILWSTDYLLIVNGQSLEWFPLAVMVCALMICAIKILKCGFSIRKLFKDKVRNSVHQKAQTKAQARVTF